MTLISSNPALDNSIEALAPRIEIQWEPRDNSGTITRVGARAWSTAIGVVEQAARASRDKATREVRIMGGLRLQWR